MSNQNNTHSDTVNLMKGIGQKARAASRAMARASTASKNEAARLDSLLETIKKKKKIVVLANFQYSNQDFLYQFCTLIS